MKKEKNTINIIINSKDETKSQIIYNNVITNMEKISLTKDEQLDYLKSRITELEQDQKNKIQLISLISLITIIFIFGLFLIVQKFTTIGIIISVLSFIIAIVITNKITKKQHNENNDKYEEIETIRKLISSKLK